jgi:DNA polymerase I
VKLISFDVETRGTEPEFGLQPARAREGRAWLTAYAWATDKACGGKLAPPVAELRLFLNKCAKSKATIVGWNTPFDVAWLIALGLREEVHANKWLDAMLLWKHAAESPRFTGTAPKSYGLKAAVATFLPDEAGYEKDIDFNADTPEALAALLQYNKLDAQLTLRLAHKFLSELTPAQQRVIKIEAACIPLVAESYVNGIHIDRAATGLLDTKLDETAKLAFVKLKLDSPEHVTPEVLASPAQLADLLYTKWGLHAPKLTEKGALSTDKEALHELALTDPRAKLIHEYREAIGNRTKFVTNTLASFDYNGDGCTRPQARIFGTYTGRMTYSSTQGRGKQEVQTGIALHQWKRDKFFRSLIVPPPDHTLLEFDFSGQEFRWMAVMANDPTMLEMCMPGEDAHAYMGARIRQRDYRELARLAHTDAEAKRIRQLGKVANLSCQYRTSAPTLQRVARVQHGMEMSLMEAKAIHATYQMTYKAVPLYWRRQIYTSNKYGYVETLAGRRVLLPRDNSSIGWSLDSTAINYPIQGAGADQKYLALAVLRNYLPKIEGRFYFELHDGMFVVVPHHHAERAAHEIKHLLSNLPYKKAWGVDLPIQFPVDAKMGLSWGELKEVA